MDKFTLKMFFLELLEASYRARRPGMGNPCSELLKKMCLYQDKWLDKILGDYTNESHEFRLNGAGLKLHWRVNKDTRKFTCYISGDQVDSYPIFVCQVRMAIKSFGFEKEDKGPYHDPAIENEEACANVLFGPDKQNYDKVIDYMRADLDSGMAFTGLEMKVRKILATQGRDFDEEFRKWKERKNK